MRGGYEAEAGMTLQGHAWFCGIALHDGGVGAKRRRWLGCGGVRYVPVKVVRTFWAS